MPATSPREVPTRRAFADLKYYLMFVPGALSSVDQPVRDRGVAVDAPVAQERPVAAHVLQRLHIHFTNQDLFLIVRSFRHHPSKRIAQERPAPELEPRSLCPIAADVAMFETDTIH